MLHLTTPARLPTRSLPTRSLLALGLGLSLALAPMAPAFARGAPESFADRLRA